MIRRYILKLFRGVAIEDANARVAEANQKLASAKEAVEKAETEKRDTVHRFVVDRARLVRSNEIIAAEVGDIEPDAGDKRKEYVAQASNFYTAILKDKMLQMIAQVREMLDTHVEEVPPGMTRAEHDNFLRGTSNAFKLLMDWGDRMTGEHMENIKPNNE